MNIPLAVVHQFLFFLSLNFKSNPFQVILWTMHNIVNTEHINTLFFSLSLSLYIYIYIYISLYRILLLINSLNDIRFQLSDHKCNFLNRISTRAGGLQNIWTSGDHPNYCIVEKSPRDLRKLVVTQTQMINHWLII